MINKVNNFLKVSELLKEYVKNNNFDCYFLEYERKRKHVFDFTIVVLYTQSDTEQKFLKKDDAVLLLNITEEEFKDFIELQFVMSDQIGILENVNLEKYISWDTYVDKFVVYYDNEEVFYSKEDLAKAITEKATFYSYEELKELKIISVETMNNKVNNFLKVSELLKEYVNNNDFDYYCIEEKQKEKDIFDFTNVGLYPKSDTEVKVLTKKDTVTLLNITEEEYKDFIELNMIMSNQLGILENVNIEKYTSWETYVDKFVVYYDNEEVVYSKDDLTKAITEKAIFYSYEDLKEIKL